MDTVVSAGHTRIRLADGEILVSIQTGLSDHQRAFITGIGAVLNAAILSLLTFEEIPRTAVIAMVVIGAMLPVIRDYFGVRESTISAAAKKVEPRIETTKSAETLPGGEK